MKKQPALTVTYLFAVFLLTGYATAQTNTRISGNVTGADDKPLAYATVTLHTARHTAAVTASYTTQTGRFELRNSRKDAVWLRVSSTGYADTLLQLAGSGEQNIGTIRMRQQTTALQGVTVQSSRRLVTMRDDGISYHTENDPMADAEKALDLLKKTPMVSVDGDGKIAINGQTSFKVLVNGKESALFLRNPGDALKNFPGGMIRRIDVITNPSAKYDAEGVAGIIDIITRKNVLGYNGSISGYLHSFNPFDRSENAAHGLNGTFNFKSGRTGLVMGFNYSHTENWTTPADEHITTLSSAFKERIGRGVSNSTAHTLPEFTTELSIDLDSLNILSTYAAYSKANRIGDERSDLLTLGTAQGNISSRLKSTRLSDGKDWSVGMDYIRKFRSDPAKEFSIKTFAYTGNNSNDEYSEQLNSVGSNRYINIDNRTRDNQYTVQVDYVLPGRKNSLLELGSKMILRDAASGYRNYQKTVASDPYTLNAGNSDEFSYRQNVYSLYLSQRFLLGGLTVRAGLRMEHTTIDGDFTSNQRVVNQHYTKWVPNILVSKQLKNGRFVSAGYSQRLNRPYIDWLNPFVNNTDSLSVSTGNPELMPQLSHVLNLQYRVGRPKLFTTISVGYTYSNSYIIHGYLFNKLTGVTTNKPQNGGVSHSAFLNTSFNATLSEKLRMNFGGNVSYLKITSPAIGNQENKGFSGQLNYNGTCMATKKFIATFFSNYYFPVLRLQGYESSYYNYGFGGRYPLVTNKLLFSFYLNNLFRKNGEVAREQVYGNEQFSTNITQYSPFRNIQINLTWNFGKLSSDVSKKKGVSNNDLL